MSGEHQPNPEFVNQLEWQVRSALRRENRFSSPVNAIRRDKMKMVALIVLSAFFGAGAAVATEEVQESRAQEILLTRIEGERRIAEIQLEMARLNLQQIQERVDQGLLNEESLLDAQLAVREGETHLVRLGLNEEEVRASGQSPQDDVSAPLIGGRDFVTERLELEEDSRSFLLSATQRHFAGILDRVEAGLVGEEEAIVARRAIDEVENSIRGIRQRLELRRSFASGEITAWEAGAEEKRTEISTELRGHELTHHQLTALQGQLSQQVEAGLQTETQLTQLTLQLLQVEMEIQTLRRTLELLEESGSDGVM